MLKYIILYFSIGLPLFAIFSSLFILIKTLGAKKKNASFSLPSLDKSDDENYVYTGKRASYSIPTVDKKSFAKVAVKVKEEEPKIDLEKIAEQIDEELTKPPKMKKFALPQFEFQASKPVKEPIQEVFRPKDEFDSMLLSLESDD